MGDHEPNSVVVASFMNEAPLNLQDATWQSCIPVQITHYWSGTPAPASRYAEARLCWTSVALHVRFECEQREPLVVSNAPVTDTKTIGLWDRDVCEIFLAVDPAHPDRYFEFEAAPTGEWIDLAIELGPNGRQTEWEYSSGMKASAQLEREKILVGMTIPWSTRLPKPDVGSEWQTNLFRCVGADEATRYLAWRPTQTPEPNFHVPAAFGTLRFA